MCNRGLFLLVASLFSLGTHAQLAVDESMTPAELLQNVLLGGGVSVSNIVYNGVAVPNTIEQGAAAFTQTGVLGLDAGVILSTGFASSAVEAEDGTTSSDDLGNNGDDADLEAIVGGPITNFSILEFDFIPTGDSLKFRYVFASEEYPGFVCSYNDAFGFFLSGPGLAGPYTNGAVNIAVLPDGTTPVTIANVNGGYYNDPDDPDCPAVNPQYYVNNTGGAAMCFGGFTTVLTAFALVQCGETYHIKLAVGDAGSEFDSDVAYDSAVFLEAGSFTSTGQVIPQLVTGPGIVGNTMNEGCVPVELVFARQGDLSMAETVDIVVAGTATAGVDFAPALPAQIAFAAEDSTAAFTLSIPLDDDGPETVVITIHQLVACANQNVETVFEFVIDSPDPLAVAAPDVINGTCGQVHVLDPQLTGGVGYYVYQWSTGEDTPAITVAPEETTVYEYTIEDGCSVEPISGSITVVLPVYTELVIEVSPDLQIPCLEEDDISVVSATGGNGVYTYQWTHQGAAAGQTATVSVPAGEPMYYVVTVSEGCGQVVTDSVLVSTVPLDPVVVTPSADVTVTCVGDTALIGVVDITGGNGVYTLIWTNAAGQVLSAAEEMRVAVPTDAVYTISVNDQCGYSGEALVRTLLPHYDPFYITTNEDHVICSGDSSSVEVEVFGGSGYYTVEWLERGWTDPVLKIIPTQVDDYVVKVTDRCGEVRMGEVTVEVEAVHMDIVQENLGQDDWHLRAATVPVGLTHKWDMGDGSLYRTNEVFHSYTDLEDHWVRLDITTVNGCVGSDSLFLRVPAHLYFPTAFSPDGDGINETFGPVGHYIERFEMLVFNRWGELIYSTENMGKPWRGDVNGGDAADTGVYVYRYTASGHYFPATEGYGTVTLLKGTQD